LTDRKTHIWIPVFIVFASLIAAAMFPTTAAAGNTGSISGLVEFEDGRELGGVLVFVKGACTWTVTDADGYYVIMGVPPGKYEVRAALVGFGEITSRNVTVTADKRTRLDFIFYFWHPMYTIYEREPLFDDGIEIIRPEDIEKQPAGDFDDIILRVPGVVNTRSE
jgi:hypothetical protein